MPTACFLSPHLDDAVFSAGGTMARLRDAGWRVTLVTVFTASVPDPQGFALSCQTDKGLPPDVDYMALRRNEDAAAAAALGLDPADVHWLGLPEAPHRGYTSAANLFNGVHPDDAQWTHRVIEATRGHADACDVLFTAAGIGNHVDHLHVLAAARSTAARTGKPLVFWHDTPYVLNLPTRPAAAWACDIPTTLGRKLDACAAYTTQVAFQFGSATDLRRRMAAPLEHFDALTPGPATALLRPPFSPALVTNVPPLSRRAEHSRHSVRTD